MKVELVSEEKVCVYQIEMKLELKLRARLMYSMDGYFDTSSILRVILYDETYLPKRLNSI